MKAVISHDIDHLTVSEHILSDLIVPKFIFRSKIELFTGKITFHEYLLRWTDILKNKWQNIDELITYNNVKQIPSSFFIGVEKGTGLNYANEIAIVWANQLLNRKSDVFIHGIQFADYTSIFSEKEKFNKVFGFEPLGIRMHYVKKNEQTLVNFSKAGYLFDSTIHAYKNPFRVNTMWEFPIQIMDGWIIENDRRWQTRNIDESKEATKRIIQKCYDEHLDYIGIDFHDRYFSNSFKTWLDWYCWLTEYLAQNGIQCVSFKKAIVSLDEIQNNLL